MTKKIYLYCKNKGDTVIRFYHKGGGATWGNDDLKYTLTLDYKTFITIWDYGNSEYLDWENLNPLYLEVISEEECPECENGFIEDKQHFNSCRIWKNDICDCDGETLRDICENCTDGKIETVTGKYLFDPDEYDREKYIEWLEMPIEKKIDIAANYRELKES